jgi:uncharacterized membrane protein YccC
MSPRFTSNLILASAGATVVVASQAFSATTTGWITFAVALGALAGLGVAQLDAARGTFQRVLDVGAGVLSAWTVVASVVFNGSTLTWLSFAEAIGFVAVAIVGLAAHELSQERVVRALGVAQTQHSDIEERRTERLSTAA